MIVIALLGCAAEPAEAWARNWEVSSFQTAVTPTEPTSTGTEPAPAPDEGCEGQPIEAAFLDIGFDMTVEAMGDSWYVEVHACSAEDVCDYVPWVLAGSQDLDSDGGTAKYAGYRFLADVAGGGVCTVDWITLEIGGTPEAPDLALRTEQVVQGFAEGDALACEDQIEAIEERPCTGLYLLSGEAW